MTSAYRGKRNTMTRIIDLSNKEAQKFLMQPDQYCTTELPEYFDFAPMLSYCQKQIGEKSWKGNFNLAAAGGMSGVNLEILSNKDGKYGVRPLSLVNPFLYAKLVSVLCKSTNWEKIINCFNAFDVENISACAIPVVPSKDKKEAFHKSTTILNWWSSMEQTPIELSLQYRYMFMTDITNCYGQILPRSISNALNMVGTKSEILDNKSLANEITALIEAMQGGRNVGIPQGSVVFALLAELVLGHSDLLLKEAIEIDGIAEDYKIIRYVDDYRIFCNNRDTLERISYLLQHVLEGLNFRMNTSKTKISETIVADAVKSDKAFYIFNTPIINKKGVDFDGFQKHLYYIFEFSRKFPNSGQLKVLLSDFSKRLTKYLKPVKNEKIRVVAEINLETNQVVECDKPSIFQPKIYENVMPMIATAAQIAADNISIAHYALRVISILIDTIKDKADKDRAIERVYHKLRNLPNSEYVQLWLQTLTYPSDDSINQYDMPLCQLHKDAKTKLWNNSWINSEIESGMPYYSILNVKKLKETAQIITFKEIRAYNETAY